MRLILCRENTGLRQRNELLKRIFEEGRDDEENLPTAVVRHFEEVLIALPNGIKDIESLFRCALENVTPNS